MLLYETLGASHAAELFRFETPEVKALAAALDHAANRPAVVASTAAKEQ